MKQTYSDKDLSELTELAKTLWEIEYSTKTIKRRLNVINKTIPIMAIYHMVREDRRLNEESRSYNFPFAETNFTGVLGLAEGWNISVKDRKYLEKDVVLFADDKKTILILPENRDWWESTWFNILSISVGILGVIFGIVSIILTK